MKLMNNIMKYKWILATLLVIYLFYHFFMKDAISSSYSVTKTTSSGSKSGSGKCSCMS